MKGNVINLVSPTLTNTSGTEHPNLHYGYNRFTFGACSFYLVGDNISPNERGGFGIKLSSFNFDNARLPVNTGFGAGSVLDSSGGVRTGRPYFTVYLEVDTRAPGHPFSFTLHSDDVDKDKVYYPIFDATTSTATWNPNNTTSADWTKATRVVGITNESETSTLYEVYFIVILGSSSNKYYSELRLVKASGWLASAQNDMFRWNFPTGSLTPSATRLLDGLYTAL